MVQVTKRKGYRAGGIHQEVPRYFYIEYHNRDEVETVNIPLDTWACWIIRSDWCGMIQQFCRDTDRWHQELPYKFRDGLITIVNGNNIKLAVLPFNDKPPNSCRFVMEN